MKFLDHNNIKASGTMRQNRIGKACPLPRKQVLEKQRPGCSYQQTASDNSVTVVGWNDNKAVCFISNCDKREPSVNIHRYRRDEKKEIQLEQPPFIHKYNK